MNIVKKTKQKTCSSKIGSEDDSLPASHLQVQSTKCDTESEEPFEVNSLCKAEEKKVIILCQPAIILSHV